MGFVNSPKVGQGKRATPHTNEGAALFRFPTGHAGNRKICCAIVRGGFMTAAATTEQYTYQVGKITFIVKPVYKEKERGETIKDILINLMKAELEKA